MVWHIFKKDWRLLRWMVVAVALVNAMQRMMLLRLGPFPPRFSRPGFLATMVGSLLPLAITVLIAVLVQQDPIPGLRQDWLVRPIRRRDLLLSKILFVVLLVQGPIFVAEVCECLAAGFSLRESLGAPLSHSLWMLLALDLPALAFATLTRNLTEAVAAGVVVGLGATFYMTFTQSLNAYSGDQSGIAWVSDSIRLVWGLVAVAFVLALQYFRRKTIAARWAFGSATVLWLLAQLLPFQAAFAIQERLSQQPTAANTVQIVFEPGLGNASGRGLYADPRGFYAEGDVVLWLPLHLSGTSDDQMLIAEHVTARIAGPDGKIVELGNELERGSANASRWYAYKPIWVPESIYKGIKDERVRLEIDYSLTLLQANTAHAMPALEGSQRTPDAGWCVTRRNPHDRRAIELGCLVPGTAPCAVPRFPEDARPGKQSIEEESCNPDYAPYFGRIAGDSMSRFAAYFPFRNRNGSIDDPVEEAQLKDAQVVFRVYRPEAHFTRHIVISDIRLSDWKAK